VHVALLPTSALVPDIFTFVATQNAVLPASRTFVSGPSKTADIEMVLSIGVHGPKRLIVILYQD